MSIRIEINLVEGETFDAKLKAFFPSVFERAGPIFADENVQMAASDEEVNAAVVSMMQALPKPAPVQVPDPPETAAPKPRGRPRKNAEPETPAPSFLVRRYGGREEDTYDDSGKAADALIEMIHLANDTEALDSVIAVNATELLTWPQERQTEVADAVDAVRAQLAAGDAAAEPEAEPEVVSYPGPHIRLDKVTPLTELALTKSDARDAVQALLTAGGRASFNEITATFAKLGMKSVSALDEADPRHEQIVRWAAPRLQLSVVEGLT